MSTKSENLIHVKLEYEEALQSKKDILSSIKDTINLLRIIKQYHSLRKQELDLKYKLYKKMKELKINISKINTTLPKVKIPDFLEKEKEPEKKLLEVKKEYHDKDLESQLKEIQDKLRRLG